MSAFLNFDLFNTLTPSQFATALVPLRPTLLRYAVCRVGAHEAEDVLCECIAQALAILPRFRCATGPSGLFRWLRALLETRCVEYHARCIAHPEMLLDTEAFAEMMHTPTLPSTDHTHDFLSRLRRAVLTPRQRECLTRAWYGETQTEIALDLGISQRAVSYHIAAALTKLRALEDEPDSDFYRLFDVLSEVTVYHKPSSAWDPKRGERYGKAFCQTRSRYPLSDRRGEVIA